MNHADDVERSLKYICDMFNYRNENSDVIQKINYETLSSFGYVEIANLIKSRQIFYIDLTSSNIRIIYNLSSKFKLSEVTNLNFIEKNEKNDQNMMYIIIYKESVNANDMKKLEDFNVKYQLFEYRSLLFNITNHILVPKHELITNEETINEIVKSYSLKSKTYFPIILKNDPMAKYLYAKPGNLVKITRNSPTSGEHIIYRCCN